MFRTRNKEESFSCLLCGVVGFTASTMKAHLQRVHGEGNSTNTVSSRSPEVENDLPIPSAGSGTTCIFCDFNTPDLQKLQNHIQTEHLEQNICPLCDLVFSAVGEAERHMSTEHADLDFWRDWDINMTAEAFPPLEPLGKSEGGRPENQEPGSSNISMDDKDELHVNLRLSDRPVSYSSFYNSSVDKEDVILVHDSFEEIKPEEEKKTSKGDEDNKKEQEGKNYSNLSTMVDSNKSVQTKKQDCAIHSSKVTLNGATMSETIVVEDMSDDSFDCQGSDSSSEMTVNASETSTQRSAVCDATVSVSSTADKTFDCPFCSFHTTSESTIHYHVNSKHKNMMQEEDGGLNGDAQQFLYTCPFCDVRYESPVGLSRHINAEHPEEEVGGSSSYGWQDRVCRSPSLQTGPNDKQGLSSSMGASAQGAQQECPVCGMIMPHGSAALLAAHVNEHFQPSALSVSEDLDRRMAEELQEQERKRSEREYKAFQQLQSEFGMDTTVTAKQQFDRNLEKAVGKGQVSVSEFHQRRAQQALSDQSGVDSGNTQVAGILERLQSYYSSRNAPRSVVCAYLSNSTHHYSADCGDKGWGCGYRNFQMLLSCLMQDETYLQVLFNGHAKIPSIKKLQQLIERAWQAGFDPQGSEQLGGRVVNTRKWIGATEIVATLSSLCVKCQLLDFQAPSGPENTHPVMINWVRDYFKNSTGFTPPLYLQHQGHSRTIVGAEELQNGGCNLLLFDPGCPKTRMQQFLGTINYNTLQAIRKTAKAFRASQYQIVAVVGVLNDREFQASKRLRSLKLC